MAYLEFIREELYFFAGAQNFRKSPTSPLTASNDFQAGRALEVLTFTMLNVDYGTTISRYRQLPRKSLAKGSSNLSRATPWQPRHNVGLL